MNLDDFQIVESDIINPQSDSTKTDVPINSDDDIEPEENDLFEGITLRSRKVHFQDNSINNNQPTAEEKGGGDNPN